MTSAADIAGSRKPSPAVNWKLITFFWFHIQRLRLNRAQLIELRLQRAEEQRLRQTLEHNQRANARLREYVRELEQETERLLQIIAELTPE